MQGEISHFIMYWELDLKSSSSRRNALLLLDETKVQRPSEICLVQSTIDWNSTNNEQVILGMHLQNINFGPVGTNDGEFVLRLSFPSYLFQQRSAKSKYISLSLVGDKPQRSWLASINIEWFLKFYHFSALDLLWLSELRPISRLFCTNTLRQLPRVSLSFLVLPTWWFYL